MSPHTPNYDQYDAKHFARYRGWLAATYEIVDVAGRGTIKYFTLCGKKAIDVFMFEKEGLLARDTQGRLLDVVICEKNVADAAEIFNLVRPPLREALIIGSLEEVLVSQESEGGSGDDRSREVRKNVRNWELFKQLRKYFPFDVINFDTYGSLVNRPLGENKLLTALERLFELQQSAKTFLLFVTTPISDLNNELEAIFREGLSLNVTSHDEIRRALCTSKDTDSYDEIEVESRVALGFAKSIVLPMARKYGWDPIHKGIYVYDSPTGATKMMSSVVQLTAASSEPDSGGYVFDIIQIIEHMPKCYSEENPEQKAEVREHLASIVKYREDVRSQYTLSR
jgi:hypothetical protein